MADSVFSNVDSLEISLPYRTDAEQAVLGAFIIDSNAIDNIVPILQPEFFYHKINQNVYKQVLLLNTSGKPVDYVTLLDTVMDAGVFDSEENAKLYLYSLTKDVPTLSNAMAYAKIVRDKYYSRRIIDICRDLIENASGTDAKYDSLLDTAEKRFYDLRGGNDNGDISKLDSVLINVIENLHKLQGPDREKYLGIPTGFKILDDTITGLNKSDLVILAARPGVGKTSFALNIASNIASSRKDLSVAVFSLEMSKEQLAQRLLSSTSGVVSQAFRTGDVKDNQWAYIAEATSSLSKCKIYIDDKGGISVSEIKSKARRIKNLGLIIVDYLQLMGGGRENRVNEISEITRSFKMMAKDLDVPVLVLSQLSRENEKQSRKPRLSDLRDSGSIEQDADIVLFLHKAGDTEETQTEVTLSVAKNRHGETRQINLHWDGAHTRFTSLAAEEPY